MSRYVIFALAALAACSGPDDKDGSGETGTTGTDCPDGVFTGPVLITDYSATCDGDGNARYYVETQGWTANGRLFAQETENDPAGQWSDNHDLISYEFDECQEWDHLEAVLTTGASTTDWETNVSTVFTCAGHIDPVAPDAPVMSYAAQVDDLDGNAAHCVAWGQDPQGMIDDTAGTRINDPGFDLSGCEIGTATM
jgi:hypothetical protein